jgi:hypothetical protein
MLKLVMKRMTHSSYELNLPTFGEVVLAVVGASVVAKVG